MTNMQLVRKGANIVSATVIAVLMMGMFFMQTASAHELASVTCGVSPLPGAPPVHQTTWGCGYAGRDIYNNYRALINVGDRRHDHSCVYSYLSTNAATWHDVGVTSCTEGGQSGAVYRTENSIIRGARMYRFSPYGNNYQTLGTW